MTENKRNPVIWRYYLIAELTNVSPLLIGSGDDDLADAQCIRSGDERLFIPGTTVAGRLREFAESALQDAEFVTRAFGRADGRQSLLTFLDAPLVDDGGGQTTVRDSVRLNEEGKTAADQGKFDYETVDPGQRFCFEIHAILRDSDRADMERMRQLLAALRAALENGEISFGAKTNRGLGRMKAADFKEKVFDFSSTLEERKKAGRNWLDWKSQPKAERIYDSCQPVQPAARCANDHIRIEARFELTGSLLIRSYSADPAAPDVTPVAVPGEKGEEGIPVIPGTSWAGVLHHSLLSLKRELQGDRGERMDVILEKLFPPVKTKTDSDADKILHASNLIIDESRVENAQMVDYTRNAIDRFTGGVVNGRLFTERLVMQKEKEKAIVTFSSRVRRKLYEPRARHHDLLLSFSSRVRRKLYGEKNEQLSENCAAALLLALLDIGNGIAPVGGAASVGRGILRLISLKKDGEEMVRREDDIVRPNDAMNTVVKKLADYLRGGEEQ